MTFAKQGSVRCSYDLTYSAGGCNGSKCVELCVYLTRESPNFQDFIAQMLKNFKGRY